jgi:hypothetical protein
MVEVTKADALAAASIYPAFLASLKSKSADYSIAQAFASHREAEQERCARIADAWGVGHPHIAQAIRSKS